MTLLEKHLRDMCLKEPHLIKQVFPSYSYDKFWDKIRILYELIVRNRPLANEGKLSDFLIDCFTVCKISCTNVVDLPRPCYIVSSDLSTNARRATSDDDKLIQELINSCALPYIYRTIGTLFDGGLIANLPVDELTSRPGDDFGSILAICFNEQAFRPAATGRLNTAMLIMDATIASKTRDLKKIVPKDFVLPLSPDAGDGIVVESFDVTGFINL